MVSCSAGKKAASPTVVEPSHGVIHPHTDSVKNVVPEKSEAKENKKGPYTIAMLLPFQNNKVYVNDLMETASYSFPQESQLAVEYYQGATIALDSLGRKGLKATVLVADAGTDSVQLRSALKNPQLKDANFIIGPVSPAGLNLVADFAKTNQVYLVSPFAATVVSNLPNPYYILANASIQSHCEKTYDYIKKVENPSEVIMLYRQREGDLEIASYFKDYAKAKNENHALHFIELTDSTTKKFYQLKDLLSEDHKNIVLVPSNDEAFVRTVIKQFKRAR
jgi:ABC-type branched-subunit amino acid transport system substrate-binding protein